MATKAPKSKFIKINAMPEALHGLTLIAAHKKEHIYESVGRLVEKELKALGLKAA